MTEVMETVQKEALMSQAHDNLTTRLRQQLREIKEGKAERDWLGTCRWVA